ncbi:MAG: hypothetical protein LUH02_00095 [Erysipelotrichaceae bacterium]|nr:hypothetical protein [Erysipelotrichaceae bacterium]
MKYKIVYLKDEYEDLVTYYPHFIEWVYDLPKDCYSVKQIENIFVPIHIGKKKLLEMFEDRNDYCYFHGIHMLQNELSDDIIKIKMNEYDIEVEESGQKHDIFDILKSFSHNFYMFLS